MTPDDLRALADALIECGEDAWPTLPEPIQRAADYLRAQADAQPVAWRYWLVDDDEQDWSIATHRDGCENAVRVEPLYTHPAPAAPQPEPKREPLSEWRIVDLYRQWLANRETVSIADLMRSVERAHGIGGSDAE